MYNTLYRAVTAFNGQPIKCINKNGKVATCTTIGMIRNHFGYKGKRQQITPLTEAEKAYIAKSRGKATRRPIEESI